MGGGDLNSKKSWHPNILKNQERVWKAEQAVAEEKKHIQELQRERQQERDKMELQSLAKQNFGNADDKRLDWMYEKPDKAVQSEDYLLGKSIDKSHQADKNEPEGIPAVTKRVVGSSMLSVADDSQVDVARKLREDPLLLIKERERAARAALLNNPLHRRKIAELLRKEQDSKKQKDKDKKFKNNTKNLDAELAAKLSALGGDKNIDLAALLESSDSSSDDSSDTDSKKKKKKKRKKAKKKKSSKRKEKNDSSESDDNLVSTKVHNEDGKKDKNRFQEKRSSSKSHTRDNKLPRSSKRKSEEEFHYSEKSVKRNRNDYKQDRRRSDSESSTHRKRPIHNRNRELQYSSRRTYDKHDARHTKTKMSDQERASKLAEMAAAGAQREVERGNRVAQQRVDEEREHTAQRAPLRNEARALPDSVESRIHSNRHYIQRGSRHMNEHFARR